MTKFVNTGDTVDHYYPAGHGESLLVENGQVVDVGDAAVEEGDDCWLIGDGDDVRAWPKSRWEKQGSRSAGRTSRTSKDSEAPTKDQPESPAE